VGDEGHQSVTQEEFERRNRNGGFLISWSAHGLHYGIPIELASELASGRNVVVNGSRAAVPDLVRRVKDVVIVEISAPHDVIAKRLLARGREDPKQVEARLARVTPPLPAGTSTIEISNDSDVETGIAKLVSALISHATAPTIAKIATRPEGESATSVATTRLAPPSPLKGRSTEGEHAVRAKEGGDELTEPQYRTVLGEFVEGKYSEEEIGRFLVAASRSLTTTEAVAIAKVRAEFARKIPWNEPIVVDKHSMGGIPGSRITLIVVPIVAAHGLAMPKTSSRAITSAAGTADAMETIARVDLDIDAVQRVVSVARGCIAWNGRLNHSALDDVMNAITRPLRLDSAKWSVASILSKKLSAGVTNVIIDLPYGKYAKLKSQDEAVELSRLFGEVGRHLDLTVETCLSQGDEPIGRGVGPALEVRDVMEVLECSARAPQDLRKKALGFAARILRWAPDITSDAAANSRAESLLNSGAAKLAFERIIETQGRRTPTLAVGSLAANIVAPRSGVVG